MADHGSGDSSSDWDTSDAVTPRPSAHTTSMGRLPYLHDTDSDDDDQSLKNPVKNNQLTKPAKKATSSTTALVLAKDGKTKTKQSKDQLPSGGFDNPAFSKTPSKGHSKDDSTSKEAGKQSNPPPYDFREAITDGQLTQSQVVKPPGKARKGATYDPANQPDPDEQTLSGIQAGFKQSRDSEPVANSKGQVEYCNQKVQKGKEATISNNNNNDIPANSDYALYCNVVDRPDSRNPQSSVDSMQVTQFYSGKDGKYTYPFVVGDERCLEATEEGSQAYMPAVADRAEKFMKRFWHEVFTFLRMILSSILFLLVELVLFVLRDIFHKYIIRILAAVGDFLLKPLLSVLFNDFVQPLFTFLWNTTNAMRHALVPVIAIIGSFSQQVAIIIGAFRLVEVNGKGHSVIQGV